jgi:hypothetical protein
MGRFDALSNLEEPQEPNAPPPVVVSPTLKHVESLPIQKQQGEVKKPANPFTRKTVIQPPAPAGVEKPERYTTRLEPSLVKRIRLDAIEKDMKDYEIVKTALAQYFERNK